MQCKWWTNKEPTRPKVKKNSSWLAKNNYYTFYWIRISLSLIHYHGKNSVWVLWGRWTPQVPELLPTANLAETDDLLIVLPKPCAKALGCSDACPTDVVLFSIGQFFLRCPICPQRKNTLWVTLQILKWNWWQWGHLSNIGFPLKEKLGGDVPSLDGYDNLKVWGELTDSAPNPNEFLEDFELLLFLEDYLDTNLKLFLFWNFPLANLSLVYFSTLKANCIIFL